MSVAIRLKRIGAKHRPYYRIVVTDSRMPRDGRFIASVGTYDPLSTPSTVTVNGEQVKQWVNKGARPSLAVKHLLKRAGVVLKEPVVSKKASKKPREAVSQDELRADRAEETEQGEVLTAGEETPKKAAAPRKKAPSQSGKSTPKGASKKKAE
ncbi:MAG: 30S ribosomal protein S16 [Candidatus Eisenbacteria bacterium]